MARGLQVRATAYPSSLPAIQPPGEPSFLAGRSMAEGAEHGHVSEQVAGQHASWPLNFDSPRVRPGVSSSTNVSPKSFEVHKWKPGPRKSRLWGLLQ